MERKHDRGNPETKSWGDLKLYLADKLSNISPRIKGKDFDHGLGSCRECLLAGVVSTHVQLAGANI